MAEQTLTRWLKAGYPYLKAGCGLPPWLLPEHSLNHAADELGDGRILRMSQPLQLTNGIEAILDRSLDPAVFSAESWQKAVMNWPHLSQVRPVIEAFLEVSGRVTAQFGCIRAKVDPIVICRSLAVLLFAPFIAQGRPVLEEIAGILDGDVSRPSELIISYAQAVVSGDVSIVEKVNGCIVKYTSWVEWAAILQEQVLNLKYILRLIVVTPPLSSELTNVLTLMIKEAQHDEPGRDYSEHPAS